MKPTGKVTIKRFLKCPCCGRNSPPDVFREGKYPGYALQALTQMCVGAGKGVSKLGEPGKGSFIWSKRPMTSEELENVGAAIATAGDHVRARMQGEELPDLDYASMLAHPDLDQETLDAIRVAYVTHVEELLDAAQERLNQ